MRSLKFVSILLGSIGLLFFSACGNNNNQGINSSGNSATTPANSPSETTTKSNYSQGAKRGQVVESGSYHFELAPEKSDKGFHLDLFVLTGDNHQPIPNAKVTGQVQLPDGKQKSLVFTYDAKDKHYTALLPEKASGQYQLKVTTDINGKIANARFSFKQ